MGRISVSISKAMTMTTMMMVVVMMMIPHFALTVTETKDPRENVDKESWEKLLFYHRPTFKMIRRQVRNFRLGYVGTLTLVFRSSTPFEIRWFRQAPEMYLVNSEIPNKISVEGDPAYRLTIMKSGDVTCTKLSHTIGPNHRGEYAEYVTVFTSKEGSIQYQISSRVKVKSHGGASVEAVDGPDWLITPPRRAELQDGRHLTIHCALLLSKESRSFTDELSLLKEIKPSASDGHQGYFADQRQHLKLDFTSVVSIHKDTPNKVETQDDSLLIGRRHKLWLLDSHEVIYELNLTSPYNQSHSGRYLCTFDRSYDRLYHLSQVIALPPKSAAQPARIHVEKRGNAAIAVELISCRSDNYANDVLILYRGMPTCIRCRATGGDGLRLGLFRNGVELETYLKRRYLEDRNYPGVKRSVSFAESEGNGKSWMDRDSFHGQGWKGTRNHWRKIRRNANDKTARAPPKPNNDLALITNKHIRNRDEDSRELRGLTKFPLRDTWDSVGQVGVARFIHVADGGVHEVTFTFHRPTPALLPSGEGYSCLAEEDGVKKSVKFKIEYAP